MALRPPSEVRRVSGLSETEAGLIRAFVQGAVYCWIKNRKGERFAVRDLVGGENTDWTGTSLEPIYKKHRKAGKTEDEAFEAAAKDIGWVVKGVLADDQRVFEVDSSGYTNTYRWCEMG
ncbi:hypothetical protein [Billgrantia kenyensis]|uniref:Uncharacterized protein n=1 Tax=Billgrantia kenyensis TaxID=321266 RepID=A0A7V9W4Y0_9GAMM|nr:hypothetical protein [Halomonas kenyensis]MBA2781117.1 hypothetical protein [Halomonas kenyensis]MCG6659941.1 hypothetical protein [Halomonas kenyensis]